MLSRQIPQARLAVDTGRPLHAQRAQRKANDEGKAALLRRAGADRRTDPPSSTNRRLGRPLLCGLRPRKGNSERQKRKAKRIAPVSPRAGRTPKKLQRVAATGGCGL